jgi:hypothetical protein
MDSDHDERNQAPSPSRREYLRSTGLLLFPSSADYEAHVEQEIRSRLEARMRDHIRGHPEFTAAQVACYWAALAIANAAEGSREATDRKRAR